MPPSSKSLRITGLCLRRKVSRFDCTWFVQKFEVRSLVLIEPFKSCQVSWQHSGNCPKFGPMQQTYFAILPFIIGIGALIGGFGLITAPDGSNLDFELHWLENSPFSSYFMPGLVLMLIPGVGNLIAGFFSIKGKILGGPLNTALGIFLVLWIIVQMLIIPFHLFQPLYFLLGILQALSGLYQIKQPKG